MKLISGLSAICLSVALLSCSKDDDPEPQTPLTNAEAAEIIAGSLSEDADGLTVAMVNMTTVTNDALEADNGGRVASACDYSKDSTFTKTRSTTLITSSYDYEYSYAISCTTLGVPKSMDSGLTYSGEYETARVSSANSGTATVSLTGLELTETDFVASGTYTRSGSFMSKVRDQNAVESTLTLTFEDLTVNKSSYLIKGGTISVALTGSATDKGDFSYSASIVFNGDKSATITINGETYDVDLESGEIQ